MKKPLDELVRAFGNEVVLQELAASRGDPDTGNVHAGKYFAAFDALYAEGDQGLHAATKLLRDERTNVRSVLEAELTSHAAPALTSYGFGEIPGLSSQFATETFGGSRSLSVELSSDRGGQ
jgi:hypothetical protein